MEGADAVYPASASALARGRRVRTPAAAAAQRARRKTMPVTFAEIKEVDEENAELGVGVGVGAAAGSAEGGSERRRRPDVLDERLGTRRGRARAHVLPELSPPPARAGSEPAELHLATELHRAAELHRDAAAPAADVDT